MHLIWSTGYYTSQTQSLDKSELGYISTLRERKAASQSVLSKDSSQDKTLCAQKTTLALIRLTFKIS